LLLPVILASTGGGRQRKPLRRIRFRLIPANGAINASHAAQRPRSHLMRFVSHLPMIVYSLALNGCVAAPLAQMAVSQIAAPQPACSGCTTETTTSTFISLSHGVSDSFHRLTGPDNPKATGDTSAK
jgi:hypothetical protein